MDSSHKIKVLIVDDHQMVRQSLQIMLETYNEFEVVGYTGDARFALSLCNKHHPDIVLMDLLMPHMDGITATRIIRNKFPEIEIVALTSSIDDQIIREALNAGVASYILKTASINEVANAIQDTYNGKPALSPEAIQVLLSTVHHPVSIGHNLSKQELRVLQQLTKGLTNRQIAEIMCISQSTVKAHIGNIFEKLQISSRTKAIAIAIQHQLVDTSET